jgi:hypothetical protein
MVSRVERKACREDVLAYAAELRVYAKSITSSDPTNPDHVPDVQVWSPSNEYAEYLVRARGPARALEILKDRAQSARKAVQLEVEMRSAQLDRERRRRDRESREAEELASGLSPGARINRALAELQLLSEGATANLDGEIPGVVEHPSRIMLDKREDEYRKARSLALATARKVESALDRARRSPLPPRRGGNRDERLAELVNFSPEEIAVMEPDQGLPRQIRDRRQALGLDEETGRPSGEAA